MLGANISSTEDFCDFNGVLYPLYQWISYTEVICKTPPGSNLTTVNVSLKREDGSSQSVSFPFTYYS